MSAPTWDEIFKKQQWGRYPNEMVVREVCGARAKLGANPVALDLGCGAGAHTLMLLQEGFAVEAVDASTEALKQAQKHCSDRGSSHPVYFHRRDYIKQPMVMRGIGGADLILDWLSLTHASLGTIKRVAVKTLGLLPLVGRGVYILGVFGNNTSPDVFKDRPKCTLIDSHEILRLIDEIRTGWAKTRKSRASAELRQSSHWERMLYTRNGSQVELFCLVFSKD